MSGPRDVPRDASESVAHDGCGACPVAEAGSRRRFLQQAALALAAVGLGALPLPLAAAQPRRAGEERRYALPQPGTVHIDREHSVIVARFEGRAYAFALACPHQNTALRWQEGDGEFRCPKHKSRYQRDGTFISGRATRAMDRLAIRRDGGDLVIRLDLVYEQDTQPGEWAAAYVVV